MVTEAILVGILADADNALQAFFPVGIADVILIFVYVACVKFTVVFAEEIALMVKIGILAYAQNIATQIAFVIDGIFIQAFAKTSTANITDVIGGRFVQAFGKTLAANIADVIGGIFIQAFSKTLAADIAEMIGGIFVNAFAKP